MTTAKTPSGFARRFLNARWLPLAVLAAALVPAFSNAQSNNHPPGMRMIVESPDANSDVAFDPSFGTSVPITARLIGPEPFEADEVRFKINQWTFVGADLDLENRITMNWFPPAPGRYEVVAEIDAEDYTVSSEPLVFFVTGAEMHIPYSGARIPGGSTVAVRGEAYSPLGVPISRVEYYANGESIGESGHYPYTVFWTVPEAANIQNVDLTAEVHFSDGTDSPSTIRSVQVVPRAGQLPTVAVVDPADGDTVSVPESGGAVTIKAEAAAQGEGTLENVEFFVNGRSVGIVHGLPLQVFWTPRFEGTYTLHALATDDKGNATLSTPVTATVSGDLPPAPPPGVDFTTSVSGWRGEISPLGGPGSEVFSFTVNVESSGAPYPSTSAQNNASVYLIPASGQGNGDGDERFLVGRFNFSVPAGAPNAKTTASNPFSSRINAARNAEAIYGAGLTAQERDANRPPPGHYYLEVRVDGGAQPLGAVFVSEEPAVEVTALPNLAFQNGQNGEERGLVYASGNYRPGEYVRDLAVSFKNIGNAPISEDYYIEVRLSSDTVYGNSDDFLLTRIPGVALDVDGPLAGSGRVTIDLPEVKIPGNFPAGAYFVAVKLDSMDQQEELNVANNVLVDTVTPQIMIDSEDFPFTRRMSQSANGAEGNAMSDHPAVSADGRYVAFNSDSSNLVSGDNNGVTDVFVRDTVTGAVVRVSVDSDGEESDGPSYTPAISADGRFVVFVSDATNLVDQLLNGRSAVYLHDRDANNTGVFDEDGGVSTLLVSVNDFSVQANRGAFNPAISGDGRFVAFESRATNLATVPSAGFSQVFVHDTHTGKTVLASKDEDGIAGNADSYSPSLSAYGRYVAFSSSAGNLTSGLDNGVSHIYVHDRDANGNGVWDEADGIATVRVSVDGSNLPADAGSFTPSISADGRFIAFASSATNLPIGGVPGIDNGVSDIYVHDRQSGETFGVSVPDANVVSGDTEPMYPEDKTGVDGRSLGSLQPSISGDGRLIAFRSTAHNLVDHDRNDSSDVFVHDRTTGETLLVSVNRFGEQTGQNFVNLDGSNSSRGASISGDGRFIAFASEANNLVHGATNLMFLSENNKRDVFVHDRRSEGALADLEITALTYPAGIHPGGTSVEVAVDLINAGEAAVPSGTPIEVQLYLSPDRVSGNGNDIPLDAPSSDFVYDEGLLSGESVVLSGFVTVPVDVPLGRFYLYARVGRMIGSDSDTLVAESNYRNNHRFGSARNFSTNNLPDFTFTGDQPLEFEPGTYAPGSTLPITVTIVNEGAPNFSEVDIVFYLSPDGDPANGDNIEFSQVLTTSGIGSTPKTVSGNLVFPEGAISGENYWISAVINPDEDPQESDTDNNFAVRSGIKVLDAPDLTLTNLAFDSFATYAPEDTLQVVVSGDNLNESVPGEAFQVEVVFVDGAGNEFRQPNSSLTVSPGQIPFELTFNISLANLPLGDYRVRAIVDPDNAIEETNTNNNQIESAAANLRVFSPEPIVSLVSPVDGLTVSSVSSVLMTAIVDSNKAIDRVEFRVDGSVIEVDRSAPYSVRYRPSTLGTKSLTAVAIDSSGVAGESQSIQVQVVAPATAAPVVELTRPLAGSEVLAGASVRMEASASPASGSAIEEVTFYVNGFPVGGTAQAPYQLDQIFQHAGTVELRVGARDNSGNQVVSAAIMITVREPDPAAFDSDFLNHIYSFLLGRFPNAQEREDALDALASGQATRAGLVLQVMEEPRFRALVMVWSGYEVALGRFPDTDSEVEAAWSRLRQQAGLEFGLRDLMSNLLSSDEFVDRFGQNFHLMPARDFVRQLYANIGQVATSSQISSGEKAIDRMMSRAAYAADFVQSLPALRAAMHESAALVYALRGEFATRAEAGSLASFSREGRVTFLLEEEGLASPASYLGATLGSGGTKVSPWLDEFSDSHYDHVSDSGWIRHSEHGWWYRPAGARSWVWDHIMQDWLWTNAEVYPFVYSNNNGNWYYYNRGGSPDKRAFYDYQVNAWISIEK